MFPKKYYWMYIFFSAQMPKKRGEKPFNKYIYMCVLPRNWKCFGFNWIHISFRDSLGEDFEFSALLSPGLATLADSYR